MYLITFCSHPITYPHHNLTSHQSLMMSCQHCGSHIIISCTCNCIVHTSSSLAACEAKQQSFFMMQRSDMRKYALHASDTVCELTVQVIQGNSIQFNCSALQNTSNSAPATTSSMCSGLSAVYYANWAVSLLSFSPAAPPSTPPPKLCPPSALDPSI